MKRIILLFSLVLFIIVPTFLGAQASYQAYSDYYRVFSDTSGGKAEEVAKEMDACLKLYNEILHFDITQLGIKLKVRIFSNKTAFDSYLTSIISGTREDFVYIHYSDLGKCEVVGFESGDQEDFDSSLLHQGLIQFIKAFVPNPPLWIQEGLAAYFEQAEYDSSTLSFTLKTDLVWLDTLKNIIRGNSTSSLIPISDLLLIDKTTALEKIGAFYPQVWGMIHFLINSQNKQVNRILWDSIKSMDSALSMLDNAKNVKDNVFFWYGISKFEEDYKEYILGLKTFAELLKEGMAYYNNNELKNAEESFSLALKRESANYIPYYYLGLISYSNKNYSYADQYYNTALQKGAPTALINYALGVNAFADNNFSTAKTYLNEAKKYDPVNYTEKVDTLLKRIEGTSE